MIGEDFFSIFNGKNKAPQKGEINKTPEKGTKENPYSKSEFTELKTQRLKKDQMFYFSAYVENSSDEENSSAYYLNFVHKDSDRCSVNFTKSQDRIAVSLVLKKREDDSFETNNLLLLLKSNGKVAKEISLKINNDLSMDNKRELVANVYRKLENDFNHLTAANKQKGELKEFHDQELRQELFFSIAAFVREKSGVDDASDLIKFN